MRYRFSFLTGFILVFSLLTNAQSLLSLKAALKQAKLNNSVLKTAFYNIGIVETDIITSKLRPNPILNNQTLQSINAQNHAPNTDFFSPYNRQVWWQLTKPIRLPQQRKYKLELAQQNVLLERNYYGELERNLSLDVANQWLDTWFLQTKLDLYLEAQLNIDTLVKINELRLKNLVITNTDLVRTKLIAEQYHLQIRTIKQSYQSELKKLKLLLGATDSISINVKDEIEPMAAKGFSIDSLIAVGQSNRTDVKVSKSTIDVSLADIRFQKSMAMPMPEVGMIWNPQNTIPYLGFFGTVQIPIFSRNQGEIAKAQLVKEQAQKSFETLQQRINTEIRVSFQNYRTQRENLQKYESILSQSEAVLNSVRYAYLKGGTTIIDFLEAQRTWFDTRQIYFDALLSYRKSYIQLLYSTGVINQLYE